jgi:geranylgeranyl pyrophosphate synthase
MQCGGCCIGRIQAEAEKLGYVVLIAEGTTVVTKLLESGKVDAVMGVSCMDVLEKTFPFLVSGAIPGVAVPLLRNGCRNTALDESWVMEAIHLSSEKGFHPYVNIDRLKEEVRNWFAEDELWKITGRPATLTEEVALDWLGRSGKRWRPFLAAAVYGSLTGGLGNISEEIRRVCVAVECFHKASLVHDDIADNDDYRYGSPTLHKEHEVPFALNAGDFLVGLGYRLLSGCGLPSGQTGQLVYSVSLAHAELCVGQGNELALTARKEPVSSRETIEIFRSKTSPSFRAALLCGAVCAGGDGNLLDVVDRFSNSLGVAYQIRDDLGDFEKSGGGDACRGRLSLLFSLAYERCSDEAERNRIVSLWGRDADGGGELSAIAARLDVENMAKQMMEHYKQESLRCLAEIDNGPLNALLRKLVRRIVK